MLVCGRIVCFGEPVAGTGSWRPVPPRSHSGGEVFVKSDLRRLTWARRCAGSDVVVGSGQRWIRGSQEGVIG